MPLVLSSSSLREDKSGGDLSRGGYVNLNRIYTLFTGSREISKLPCGGPVLRCRQKHPDRRRKRNNSLRTQWRYCKTINKRYIWKDSSFHEVLLWWMFGPKWYMPRHVSYVTVMKRLCHDDITAHKSRIIIIWIS